MIGKQIDMTLKPTRKMQLQRLQMSIHFHFKYL